MLTVTDDARAHLATILDQNDIPQEQAVRLLVGPNGLGLAPDMPKDEDAAFDHAGRTVLVIEPSIADQLDGRTMDVEQTDQGTQIKLS
jgi:Fe-S cluster assembly iron-binding protein IscA